jgi:serine/threonine protein kinase
MGAVYKARQTSLNRFVALKILPVEANEDPAFGERFQREARALAQLSHPNIVGVHDYGQTGGFAYLVMEFVDGANLRQLQRAGHLSPREAMAIVPQICEALQFAHDRGIVHRDIKPENILIDTQGRVKIADFGLAKMMRLEAGAPDLTLTRHAVGTPQYMAPEQIEKPETVDHRADIYSLGVVFYEMLTGELPIGRFAAPSGKVQIDVRLDEVVLKALEKEPALRYQQASAFKTEVETVAGGTAPLPAPSPAAPPFAAPVSGTDDSTNQPPVWNEAANAPAVPVHPPSPAVPPARQKNSRWWTCLQLVLGSAFLFLSYMILNRVFGMARDELFSLVFAVAGLVLVAVGVFNAVKERWSLPPLVLGFVFLFLSYMILNRVFGMARDELFSLVFAAVGLVLVAVGVFKSFWPGLVTAGILMLFLFPVGTVLGVLLLVYVGNRRGEFGAEEPGSTTPPAKQKKSGTWILLILLLMPLVLIVLSMVLQGLYALISLFIPEEALSSAFSSVHMMLNPQFSMYAIMLVNSISFISAIILLMRLLAYLIKRSSQSHSRRNEDSLTSSRSEDIHPPETN